MTDIENLVGDALYYRRSPPSDSCFISNTAGLDLIGCGVSALDHIERALRDTVAPRSHSSVPDEFLGLSYILGAYAIIGSTDDPTRTVAFLRTLPTPLQAEFIAVLPIFFDNTGGHYKFGIGPARPITDYVREYFFRRCAFTGCGEARGIFSPAGSIMNSGDRRTRYATLEMRTGNFEEARPVYPSSNSLERFLRRRHGASAVSEVVSALLGR